MQNIKKLLGMMLMIASVFFIACDNNEDEVKKMSVEEAKATLEEMSTSMTADFDMVETDGLDAMAILMNLDDPFGESTKSSGKNSVLNNLNEFSQLNKVDEKKKLLEADPTDFSSLTGTYEWYDSLQRWSVDPTTPVDAILIKFPADSTDLDNNNAAVTISNYSEVLISELGMPAYYNPTSLSYDLAIDNIKYLGIDITATWDTETGEPTDFTQDTYIKPINLRQELESTATTMGLGLYIDNEAENIFSADIDAVFATTVLGDEPSTISGSIIYGDINIKFTLDFTDIEAIAEQIESDIMTDPDVIKNALNEVIDATIYYDGQFLADIEFRYNLLAYVDVDMEDYDDVFPFYPVFVFSDGTEESAVPFFEEFTDSLDEFFSEIEDYFDDFFGM